MDRHLKKIHPNVYTLVMLEIEKINEIEDNNNKNVNNVEQKVGKGVWRWLPAMVCHSHLLKTMVLKLY